jgi:hypothetical protein
MNPRIRAIIERREQSKRHLAWVRRHGVSLMDRRLIMYAVYQEPKRKWRASLSDKTRLDHAIVTQEDEGYLLSILKQPNQNKESYVEIMLKPEHAMYQRVHDAVGMLNIAGVQTEVQGVGEAFQAGVYHIVLTSEEHKSFLGD